MGTDITYAELEASPATPWLAIEIAIAGFDDDSR